MGTVAEHSASSTKKESIMKRSYKVAATVSAMLGLGVAAAAFAHQGAMGEAGSGMGPGMGRGMAMHGSATGRAAGQASEHAAMEQIISPEERTALMEKMRSAKTPEERQQLAAATRAEMEKRARDKGITLPEQRGPQGRSGATATPRTPATPGHTH
jgi:hypothetical protein